MFHTIPFIPIYTITCSVPKLMIVIQYDLKPPATISWNLQSDMLRFQPEKKLEVALNYLKKVFSACNMQHKKKFAATLQRNQIVLILLLCCSNKNMFPDTKLIMIATYLLQQNGT